MVWPIIFVTVGLALTLAGMIITFIVMPPTMTINPSYDGGSWDDTQEERTRRAGIKKKLELSKVGVWLLASGTFLQLFGTGWQVVRLACRR